LFGEVSPAHRPESATDAASHDCYIMVFIHVVRG
jgi:hypothetical protein